MTVHTSVASCRVKATFTVKNLQGIHTRPSTEIVKCAANFKSDIRLTHRRLEVNAKSILGVMMLAATKGAKIVVSAFGEDAEEAVASIIELADNEFKINLQ